MKKSFQLIVLSFLISLIASAQVKTIKVAETIIDSITRANKLTVTPLVIAASKMTNLNTCALSADATYIGSTKDGSSVILGDSIDFGTDGNFNKVSSNMFLIYGDIHGQRSGELDLYLDNQTIPFASLRIHLPVKFNTDYIISKRFEKITGKHKVKIVWDWYVANLKNITFSYESGAMITPKKEIKIACLGNSITEGTDAGDRVNKGYVGLLEQMLGEDYQVRNYGYSGSSACQNTSKPYYPSIYFTSAINFQPDIVTIGLGTNDSKTDIWAKGSFAANFKTDYTFLVNSFAFLKSKPKVYICIPPPIFPSTRWTQQPDTLSKKIIPKILEIAKEKGLEVIDFYSPIINHNEYFAAADQLHPLAIGHQVMADQAYKVISGNVSTKALLDSLKQLTIQTDTLLAHAIIGTTPGTYSATSKSVLLILLNKAKAMGVFNMQYDINQSIIDLTNALKSFKLSFNYTTNTLPAGDYYIKKAGTNLFWTNTGVNKTNLNYFEENPVFSPQIVGNNDQVFHVTLQSNGRYRIDSKSDVPAYINEGAKIRRDFTNYYLDLSTLNILYNGAAYAVQPAGSGANAGFWILVSDTVSASGIIALNKETNFVLDFVTKSSTAVPTFDDYNTKVFSVDNGVQIVQNQKSLISIFDINGSMLKSLTTNGNTIVPLASGFYLVKIIAQNSNIIRKAIVK
jgi:lysophospholipase L1-like esterase